MTVHLVPEVLASGPILSSESMTKIVQMHFGDDYRYFTGTAIPPGQVHVLFSKAHQLWRQFNSAETSYKEPKTVEWHHVLIQPLVTEALRSENPEDLAMFFGWIHTCRFAFGFQAGAQYPLALTDLLRTISDKLRLNIGTDHKTIVTLFELLNRHVSNDSSEIDYFGRGHLCELLCKLSYSCPNVVLKDMTAFCSANILSLAGCNGGSTDNDLAYCIPMKAKSVLEGASDEDKTAFIKAFQEISRHFTFYALLGNILSPELEGLNPENLSERLERMATKVRLIALQGRNILQ